MKTAIIQEEKKWTPFSLTINFESRDEVIALFHQMNISTSVVEENKDETYEFDDHLVENVSVQIWKILQSKLEEN